MSLNILTRAAIAVGGLTLLIVLGCVSHRPPLVQQDRVKMTTSSDQQIVFKVPYASPPIIQVKDETTLNNVTFENVTTTGFTLHNNAYEKVEATWIATGDSAAPQPKSDQK